MGTLARFLKGIKKPWEFTGLTSTVDYLEYLPSPEEYRKHSPGSQPVSAIVPHDVPALVYDTRYYGRDYRRNNKYVARTVDRTPLDADKMVASLPLTPEEVQYSQGPPNGYVRARGT